MQHSDIYNATQADGTLGGNNHDTGDSGIYHATQKGGAHGGNSHNTGKSGIYHATQAELMVETVIIQVTVAFIMQHKNV